MRRKGTKTKFNPKMFVLTRPPEDGDFGIDHVIHAKPGSGWSNVDLLIQPPIIPQSRLQPSPMVQLPLQPSEPPDSQSQPSVQGVEQLTSQWESLTPQTSFSLLSDESLLEYEDNDSWS
jgi:hypothetical protein